MKHYVTYNSPIGLLHLISEEERLMGLTFEAPDLTLPYSTESDSILDKTRTQLNEYFFGKRKTFDLELHMIGTDFQKKAWRGLRSIPHGQTRTYAQQADLIGHPEAVRAVGSANGKNPISIVVPCHRVIRTDGTLGGYDGGLSKKEFLLHLEKNYGQIANQ